MFYKIEEAVGGGYYITWEGIFSTLKAAEDLIKLSKNPNARAVLYRTGGCPSHGQGGPVRAT